MDFYANLHMHSTHSDGVYSPAELVAIAKAEGYKALAITDHDVATAYPQLKKACDEAGMDCIFGAEFSSPSELLKGHRGLSSTFHITAFHFDPQYPAMKEYLSAMSQRETDQTEYIFERGIKRGTLWGISWKDVLEFNRGITWLCNDHVFRTMLHHGVLGPKDYPKFYADNWADKSDVPPSRPFKPVEEIIALIREAGGIAMVAHPHEQLQYLDILMEMGLEGLEAWHPDLLPEEREKAYQLALEKGLYISGGSDHSGLCGGQYQFFDHPEECEYYLPPRSVGTTYEYFMEIKNGKLNR